MCIRDAGELLRVLKDWKEAGLELRRDSHPAVGVGSEAHALLMRLLKEREAQAMATPAGSSDSPTNPQELLAWCETQMKVLAERVREGGAAAANHDPIIHQIGRDADALARAFCPPDLILGLPTVPVTAPHIYDHQKTLTVLHAVAQWCRRKMVTRQSNRKAPESERSFFWHQIPPAPCAFGSTKKLGI